MMSGASDAATSSSETAQNIGDEMPSYEDLKRTQEKILGLRKRVDSAMDILNKPSWKIERTFRDETERPGFWSNQTDKRTKELSFVQSQPRSELVEATRTTF